MVVVEGGRWAVVQSCWAVADCGRDESRSLGSRSELTRGGGPSHG